MGLRGRICRCIAELPQVAYRSAADGTVVGKYKAIAGKALVAVVYRIGNCWLGIYIYRTGNRIAATVIGNGYQLHRIVAFRSVYPGRIGSIGAIRRRGAKL